LHENGVLFEDEYYVVFTNEEDPTEATLEQGDSTSDISETTNIEESESWRQYVDQLLNDID
jgi:hypothetical protein